MSTTTDAASRQAALNAAHNDARANLALLESRYAQAQQDAHDALTAADFDASQKHQAAAEAARASLPAANAAVEALHKAMLAVADEARIVEATSQRDALTDSIAATRDQLASQIADARKAALTAYNSISAARALEETFELMQRQLHETRVGLGEIERSRDPIRERPVSTLLENVGNGGPLLCQILRTDPKELQS